MRTYMWVEAVILYVALLVLANKSYNTQHQVSCQNKSVHTNSVFHWTKKKKKKTSTLFCITSSGIWSILGPIFKLKASWGQEVQHKFLKPSEILREMTISYDSIITVTNNTVWQCCAYQREDSSTKQLHLDLKARHALLSCQIIRSAG